MSGVVAWDLLTLLPDLPMYRSVQRRRVSLLEPNSLCMYICRHTQIPYMGF